MRIARCPYCGSELVPPFHFCAACGGPVGAPAGYSVYPVVPPKKDNLAWIIVLVVVLVIAVPAILAGVLYVMVSGLLAPGFGPSPPTKPIVTFSSVTKVNSLSWVFSVASASPAAIPSYYKVNFGVGTATGTALNLGKSGQDVSVTTGSTLATVSIKWTDVDGGGTVSSGDVFTITFPSAPTSGTSLTFYLLYSDGSQIQSVSWQA